jgi:hypothetical protein
METLYFAGRRTPELFKQFSETGRPVLLSCLWRGRKVKVLLGHGRRSTFKLPQSLWEKADVVVCCHPNMLDPGQRVKHIFPTHNDVLHGVCRNGVWEITPARKYTQDELPVLVARPIR